MLVSELRVQDFRNLAAVHLEPNPRFNILEGPNGAGKTNLLEAVYVLGALKSFRPGTNADLVRFGATQAEIRGVVGRPSDNVRRTVRVTVGPKGRAVRIDGKVARSLAESLGQLTVVLFAPEDLAITKGSPAGRRRFLDRAVFNRWPASLSDIRRYEVALRQRNALLRGEGADSLLDVFDEQLAAAAFRVVEWRRRYMEIFRPLFVDSLARLSRGDLQGDMSYEAGIEGIEADGYAAAYARDRRRDRARGATSRGPHTDDLACLLSGRPARTHASQGQHRALVLAMKVAEIRLLQEGLGQSPVLLLDDVASELDEDRNAQLMSYLTGDSFGGQVFLSTTDQSFLRIRSRYSCFTVRDGELQCTSAS